MTKSKNYVVGICMIVIMIFSFTGCRKENSQEKEKELVVLTEENFETIVKEMADFFMQKHPDIKVHVELLSEDSVGEYSAELKKWNTQILAGKGPDIYFLSTLSEFSRYEEGMEERLLKNVDKTMQSGAFASLDAYIEKDNFWKNTNYNKNVLKAGTYNGKQYVLPLSCDFFGLTGITDAKSPDVQNLEEVREYVTDPYSFLFVSSRWMQPAVDYANGKVLFEKEEWSEYAADCIKADIEEENHQEEKSDLFTISGIEENMPLEMKTCIALPNLQGKKMAAIEQYGAIGMSSNYKQEAYEFLMLFLNDEIEGSSSIREMNPSSGIFLSEGDKFFQENPLIFSAYQSLDGAYFPTDIERFIFEEIGKIVFSPRHGAPDNLKEQCDTLADTIYEKYRMIVEE